MTPNQGEHAQTEALRPKFGDLLRNTMASESNPRRDAYFIREVHRSGGGVNPGRWFEMTDGKGETWLSNPQNMVSAAPAQPAEGAAKVNWWEVDGDKYDDSITRAPPAPTAQAAPADERAGYTPPTAAWLEKRLAIADDCGVQAGATQRKARPCDASPGCNSHNCLECNDFERAAPALAENGHLTQAGHDLLMEATLAGATLVNKGRFVGDMAQVAPAAGAVAGPDDIDAIALTRYKVVPSHDSMFHRFAVVAGDGKQQLYLGRKTECQNMALKFAGAFLDGAFYQYKIDAAPTPAAQADSQPALDRTRIREIFMTHGFTVKEGQTDLKQYVYDAADALLRAARAPADSVPAQVLVAALIAAKQAINSMKAEAETAAQGDEQMMLEACETISNEGLQADIAIRAALASAQQPAPSAAVLDYPHARRFGGCPACGRSDCVAMSCTRTTSDDLLHIAARKQGGA